MALGPQTLDQFARRCSQYRAALQADVVDLVTSITANVADDVATFTPIDTGRARSNWVTSVGNTITDEQNVYSPYQSRWAPGHSGSYAEGGKMGERANVEPGISQARAAMGAFTGGETVYIQNNLPYIQRLDEGYSRLGADFVRDGISSGLHRAVRLFRFTHMERLP